MDLHNMLLERECIDRGILLFDDGRLYLSWIRKLDACVVLLYARILRDGEVIFLWIFLRN